jgi:hypothetical protein
MEPPKPPGYIDGEHHSAHVQTVAALRRAGQIREAEALLKRLVDAVEEEVRATSDGVAPWPYEQLAILYRKQKQYDSEVEILERYARAKKAPGATPGKLARRLEEALLLKEEGLGPQIRALRAKRAAAKEVTVNTVLGEVTIKNPQHRSIALIAYSQAEEHLMWYYDVYRREVLARAIDNLNAYLAGRRQRSGWSDSYFEFIQRAPLLLRGLPQERDMAVQQNRSRRERKEVQVLGTYGSREEAERAAEWLQVNFEPTLNAGWLDVQVVSIPES